jgi:hypothetical protein
VLLVISNVAMIVLRLQMFSDDKALFTAADKNKDGYLDFVESLSFTHPEEDPS